MQNTIVTTSHCIPHTEHPMWGKVGWTRRKWLSLKQYNYSTLRYWEVLYPSPRGNQLTCFLLVQPTTLAKRWTRAEWQAAEAELIENGVWSPVKVLKCASTNVALPSVPFPSEQHGLSASCQQRSSANVFVIIPSMILLSVYPLNLRFSVSSFIWISPAETRHYFLFSSCEILAVCWVNETVGCALEMSIRSVDKNTGMLFGLI